MLSKKKIKTIHLIANHHISEFMLNPQYKGKNFSWQTYPNTIGDMFISTACTCGTFGKLSEETTKAIREYAKEYTSQLIKELNLI